MKKALILVLIVSIFTCLVAVGFLAWTPLTYMRAEKSFENGEYEQAKKFYATLHYMDSAEKFLECDYLMAEELFNKGEYAGAKTRYDILKEYKDAEQKSLTCSYLAAARAAQDQEAAERILAAFDRTQSIELLQAQYDYVLACLSFDRHEMKEAMLAFQQLGDYADSRERVESCQTYFYDEAMQSMLARDFPSAVEKFAQAEPYGKSWLYGQYCALRQERAGSFDDQPILTATNFIDTFDGGNLYFYESVFVYVPNQIKSDTEFLIYFAGGNVDFYLDIDSVYEFCRKYSPNAVCIFRINSGMSEMEEDAVGKMIAVAERLAAECGLVIHEPSIVGTSNGAYMAMHAAVRFYLEDYVQAKNLMTLDTGYNWELEEHLLSKEERELTAALGIKFYLFEQNETAPEIDAIWDLVYSGNDVTALYGHTNDHDEITADAFKDGLFSWLLGEKDHLDERYILVPMKP